MTEPTPVDLPEVANKQSAVVQDWTEQTRLHEQYEAQLAVTDRTTAMEAADRAKECAQLIKEIDSVRKDATKPLDHMKKQIMDICRPLTEGLKKVKDNYGEKVLAWQREQAKKEAAEKKRLEDEAEAHRKAALEAAETGDDVGFEHEAQRADDAEAQQRAVDKTSTAKTTPQSYGRISGVKTWIYEITDETAIPRQYLRVNESALKAAAKIKPNPPEIPGIRWKEKHTPRTF